MYTRNHLRSHLRAIVALDHRRLIRPGKNSGQIFCVRQVYFTKSCQQIWVRVNQPLNHLNITSDVKQYYEALFLSYRPRTKCSISQHAWAFSQTVKNISKITKYIWPAGSHFCRASCGRVWLTVTLQHNKEFIMVIFYLMALSICNLQKRLIRAAFWVPPARDVHWTTENKRHSD